MSCIICGQSSSFRCQRCGEKYCSEVCQRKDWQRHKYICTLMPPLVRLETETIVKSLAVPAQPLPHRNAGEKSMIEPTLDSSKNEAALALSIENLKLSDMWREPYLPASNEYFQCRVTCMERDNIIWVLDIANRDRLERLTENIARAIQSKKPCSLNELALSDLVCVVIDKKLYRAEVMALNANALCAEMRLIDYGPVVNCRENSIYLPLPSMAEIKAFAFKVQLPANTDVQINKNLSLRMLGITSPAGIEQAQLTIPLNLPLEILANNPEVKVVNILEHNEKLKEPQVAILQIAAMRNINEDLNARLAEKPDEKFTGPFPNEMHHFFLAAKTKQGYRRAFVLDFIAEDSLFLVYEIDEGRISMTNDVRHIPSDLLGESIRVFAITVLDSQHSLRQELKKSGRDICIKFQAETIHNKEHDKLKAINATLLVGNEQVCAVRVSKFLGMVSKIGHKYWREPIKNGSLVYITHYDDYQQVSISPVATKQYADIFKSLYAKCQPFMESSNVAIGSVVLVKSADHGYYRAEITDIKNTKFSVYNIDSGSKHRVNLESLRKPCRFVTCLPVSHCSAKLKTICSIPASLVPPNNVALQVLMTYYNQKTELKVEFTDSNCSTLDLMDSSTEPHSLIARMLPKLFTPAAVELEPSKPITLNLPSSVAKKRYYFNDMERRLIPLNQTLDIMVLNVAGLHKTGYFTACSFSNEKEVEDLQDMMDKVAENGCENEDLLPGYLPDINEMCLVYFTADKSWYRGVCQKVNSQKAHIWYADFGNEETVPLEHIKPIPSTLLYGIYATKCFIDGFDKTKDYKVLEEYLVENRKIACSVLEGPKPNTRILKIPNLDDILSKKAI